MNRTEITNKMGKVKVAIIGSSNSGKTTLVNALCHKHILPEVSRTSTWLTTYLGRVPFCDFECGVMNKYGTMRTYSYHEFRQSFVYDSGIIYDGMRSRGCDQFGFVHIEHILAKHGIILVDTIGTGVNQYDTKRSAVIAKQADIIVFVYDASRSSNFNMSEMLFLKQALFPSKKRTNAFCQRIFFVPNKIDTVSSVTEVCRTLKYNLQVFMDAKTKGYKSLIQNIIPISALYARLGTAGVQSVPNREDFPNEDSYIEALQRRNFEQKLMSTPDLLGESNITTLVHAIIKVSKMVNQNKQQHV